MTELQEIRQQAYNELDKLGYTKLFDNRPKDAIPPVWEDLWFLYQKVRERQPRWILEFGSGCSTILFAKALGEYKSSVLLSMESEPIWLLNTAKSMPWDLWPNLQLIFAPCAMDENEGLAVYNCVPTDKISFLYLDGPELTDNVKITYNPIIWERVFADNFYMVVDGRPETVNFLEKHLKGKYDIQRNYEENRTTFERIG